MLGTCRAWELFLENLEGTKKKPETPDFTRARRRMAFMYSVEGELLRKIKLLRINDLALTADGAVMVTVNQEKLIKVQRLSDARDVRARMHPTFTHHLLCMVMQCTASSSHL
jgi:hypothetical protein